MILKMGFRNIIRNSRKAAIIMISVAMGVMTALAGLALINGIKVNYMNLVVGTMAGDVSITPAVDNTYALSIDQAFIEDLGNIKGVKYVSQRVVSSGILTKKDGVSSVQIVGIQPDVENRLVDNFSSKNDVFDLKGSGNVAINRNTAKKLSIAIGDKISITVRQNNGNTRTMEYTVSNLYEGKATNAAIELWVMMNIDDARKLMALQESEATQLKVFGSNYEENDLAGLAAEVKNVLSDHGLSYQAECWYDTSANEFMTAPRIWTAILMAFSSILFVLIGIGLTSIIVTSMMEQVKEVGTLKAVGMSTFRITSVYLLEMFMIITFASVVGMLLADGLVALLAGMAIEAPNEAMIFTFGGRYLTPSLNMGNRGMIIALSITLGTLAAFIPLVKITRMKVIKALYFT